MWNSNHFANLITTSLVALTAVVAGCESYDPPPEARLSQPSGGFWTEIAPIEVRFTEPVQPDTVRISVWPSEFDIEGAFRPNVQALISDCTLASSPCQRGVELQLSEDRMTLTLVQHEAFADYLGKPLVLIIHAGLRDDAGRQRRVDTLYDFQINPRCGNQAIDVDMTTGVITMAANLQVLPIMLYMYFDIAIDPATGRALVVGTFARLRPEVAEERKGSYHPDDFQPELGASAWAVQFTACVARQPDGSVFMQSDPFDVNIVVLGGIPIVLSDFMVQGTIAERSDPDGRDFGSGTLSTSGGSFSIGGEPTPVDPITTAWNGLGLFPNEVPEGMPRTCAEDPCAAMNEGGGDCQLVYPWEPGTVCPAEGAE
jgi:hypothetical protein